MVEVCLQVRMGVTCQCDSHDCVMPSDSRNDDNGVASVVKQNRLLRLLSFLEQHVMTFDEHCGRSGGSTFTGTRQQLGSIVRCPRSISLH